MKRGYFPEEGFHVEDGFDRDLPADDIPNSGRISDFDAEELSNDTSEVTLDEARADRLRL